MNTFRTIIVVLVAMSLAMLPVAGGMVVAESPGVAWTATAVTENLEPHSFRNAVDRLICGHVKPKYCFAA